VKRRDFTIGLLLAAVARSGRAQEPAKPHRIAIAIPAGPVASIDDPERRFYHAIFQELRKLGYIEGQNLTIDRYSGEGRPSAYADVAREAVSRDPEVIVAAGETIALAVRAANGTIPIACVGPDLIGAGLATSLAHPGGNVTGVTVNAGSEILGKRLQILKEAVPSASTVALLARPGSWELDARQQLRDANERLHILVVAMPLRASTPADVEGAFAEITKAQADAIIVASVGDLVPYRRLIVELAEKRRLPAMYPWRDYMDVGGLMAYAVDNTEIGRHLADQVHQILNGAKPGDIPIYQPTKYEFLVNLKTAEALGLDIPPVLLGRADEVIE
jgi:putative ABC transport system substrate-binding protein